MLLGRHMEPWAAASLVRAGHSQSSLASLQGQQPSCPSPSNQPASESRCCPPAARPMMHTAHSAQHTAHSTQRTAHSTQRTAHSAQHTAHSTRQLRASQPGQAYQRPPVGVELGSGKGAARRQVRPGRVQLHGRQQVDVEHRVLLYGVAAQLKVLQRLAEHCRQRHLMRTRSRCSVSVWCVVTCSHL